MTSVLRTLQLEWNRLVPQAQQRRIPRVRLLNVDAAGVPTPLETIAYRRAKLDWLKAQLFSSAAQFETLTFGVELECILPVGWSHARLAAEVTAAGVACQQETYNHVVRGTWKVVTDGSLGDYTRGAEVVSPPLRGEVGFEELRKVCSVLTRIGAKVNKRCGLHVHVGVASQHVGFFKNLVELYASAQGAIDQFMAPSRRGFTNGFCHPVSIRDRAELDGATTVNAVARAVGQSDSNLRSGSRYRKLNLQSFWQYGTVEFRHHQGTVESQKAENWVRFCLRAVLKATQGRATPTTFEEVMDALEMTESERSFFQGRVNFFRNQRRS